MVGDEERGDGTLSGRRLRCTTRECRVPQTSLPGECSRDASSSSRHLPLAESLHIVSGSVLLTIRFVVPGKDFLQEEAEFVEKYFLCYLCFLLLRILSTTGFFCFGCGHRPRWGCLLSANSHFKRPNPKPSRMRVSDLSPLAGLKSLERLGLRNTQVSDLSPLAGLKNLEWLRFDNTQVTDLSPLAELKNLEVLYLQNTQVSDEQVQELRQALPNCEILH